MDKRITVPAKEAAAYLGISYWTLLQMVKQQRIPCIRLGNRMILFRIDTLNEWLKQQETQSLSAQDSAGYGQLRKVKG